MLRTGGRKQGAVFVGNRIFCVDTVTSNFLCRYCDVDKLTIKGQMEISIYCVLNEPKI